MQISAQYGNETMGEHKCVVVRVTLYCYKSRSCSCQSTVRCQGYMGQASNVWMRVITNSIQSRHQNILLFDLRATFSVLSHNE